MDGYAFQGGYYDRQSYEGSQYDGYGNPCSTQAPPPNHYYDAQSQYFHPPQFHPQNSYSQYTPNYQNPYPPQPYQDSCYFSQPSHQNSFPQPSQDFNPPQYPYPPQDYSPNPNPSPIHYTPYPQDTQPPYDHHTRSPSVGRYELNEETLALARRWGITIVPDDDIEDEGYPMRPSEEEHANNQWELQESFYQEPPQISQPIDEEMRSMMNNIITQMNMLQVQVDDLKAQEKSLATQEHIQGSFSYEEIIHELFTPSEGGDEEESGNKDDEEEEEVNEEIEMETLNWEESVELQTNGDMKKLKDDPIEEVQEKDGVEEETKDETVEEEKEENMEDGGDDHIESFPFEEKLKENIVGRAQGLNEEIPSMEFVENFRRVWEPGGVNGFESVGPHWPIFISKDSQFLLVNDKDPRFSLSIQDGEPQEEEMCGTQENNQVDEYYQDPRFRKKTSFDLWINNGFDERVCLNFEFMEEQCLSFKVVDLCLKEFVDGHHLRHYLEGKFARKDGMFFLQSKDG